MLAKTLKYWPRQSVTCLLQCLEEVQRIVGVKAAGWLILQQTQVTAPFLRLSMAMMLAEVKEHLEGFIKQLKQVCLSPVANKEELCCLASKQLLHHHEHTMSTMAGEFSSRRAMLTRRRSPVEMPLRIQKTEFSPRLHSYCILALN